jgi:hypothetical protein
MTIDRNGLASDAFAITPHDTTVQRAKSIYVGGTGDVAVKTEDGTTLTFKAVPVGSILPIRTTLVLSTGTTATLLIGLR